MVEAEEYTWLIRLDGDPQGITDDLDKAEQILRTYWLKDHDLTEDHIGNRLTFDRKFGIWILFLDRMADWDYTATRIPKL